MEPPPPVRPEAPLRRSRGATVKMLPQTRPWVNRRNERRDAGTADELAGHLDMGRGHLSRHGGEEGRSGGEWGRRRGCAHGIAAGASLPWTRPLDNGGDATGGGRG